MVFMRYSSHEIAMKMAIFNGIFLPQLNNNMFVSCMHRKWKSLEFLYAGIFF